MQQDTTRLYGGIILCHISSDTIAAKSCHVQISSCCNVQLIQLITYGVSTVQYDNHVDLLYFKFRT